MIILIVLILLVIGNWFLMRWADDCDDAAPIVFSTLSGIFLASYLVLHTIFMSTAWISYESLATDRYVIEETMYASRAKGENWENAGLTIKVMEFNEKLAMYKRQNGYLLMDDWIDDRIMLMPFLR